jgi:ABC-type phosphate transport system substrate-binding protein
VGSPNEPITVVLRPAGDPLNAIFRVFVLNGQAIRVWGTRLRGDASNVVVQTVSQTPGSIGFVPLMATQGAEVRVLSIDGRAPTVAALMQGTYAF